MTTRSNRFTLRSLLDLMASGAVIVAAVVLVYSLYSRPNAATGVSELQVPPEPVSIDGAPLRGSEQARAIMVVYADFQCPFCARFARDVLPEIDRRYLETGQVAMVFRHLPLEIHPLAAPAAIHAECAGRQQQFWEMHDQLFARESLDEQVLRTIPTSLALNRQEFDDCLSDESVGASVRAAVDEAGVLGIRGTPTFLLGTRLEDGRIKVTRTISGARSVDVFAEQIDAVLQGGAEASSFWKRLFSFS